MQTIPGIVDSVGQLVVKYNYTAYGKAAVTKDTDGLASINPFRYKGYYFDQETGMYYCHTRYYVPEWGRWLCQDSIQFIEYYQLNKLNLHSYCGNNPISRFDLTSLSWNSFWENIGNWFKKTFGGFVDLSYKVAEKVCDFFVGGYEEGVSVGKTVREVGFSQTVGESTYYNQAYIRTIPAVLLAVILIFAPFPGALGTAAAIG